MDTVMSAGTSSSVMDFREEANLKLGLRMYHIRDKAGVSGCEVARRLGTSRSTYFRWECGQATIPASVLPLLCAYYDVSPSWFLGMSSFPPQT